MDAALSSLLDELRRTRFRDLSGARVAAHIPISAPLLDRIVADALRTRKTPVRHVDVRPLAGDRFDLVVTTTWPLVPPLTVTIAVDRQPSFPDSPLLVLRWSLPLGLGTIASMFAGRIRSLPDGVRLEADRIVIDVAALAHRSGAADVLPFIRSLEFHSTTDAAIVDAEFTA
jgi:hypothetical protein